MISYSQIQSYSQQIVEQFQPDQIILFGSVYKAIEIRKKLRPTFSLDLIARTSKQIQQRLEMGDFFIQDILQRGRILYETNHARVG
jgi:hypothetical protein